MNGGATAPGLPYDCLFPHGPPPDTGHRDGGDRARDRPGKARRERPRSRHDPRGRVHAGEHEGRGGRAAGAQGDREGVRDRSDRGHARRLRGVRDGASVQGGVRGEFRGGCRGRGRRQAASHGRRLERRAGVLPVRGRAAADRGGVGEGGAWHRRPRVPVGRRRRLRARQLGQLRGRGPVRRKQSRPPGSGGPLRDRREPVRRARPRRQRLGVGRGQIRRGSQAPGGARRIVLQLLRRPALRQPQRVGARAPRRRPRV